MVGRLASFYIMSVKVDRLGVAIASDAGIPSSSCYPRAFYCLPESLRHLHHRSAPPPGGPLHTSSDIQMLPRRKKNCWGLGFSPRRKEGGSEDELRTQMFHRPHCPLIKPHLGGLGFYRASCSGPEAGPALLLNHSTFRESTVLDALVLR